MILEPPKKESACSVGDTGTIPVSGRSPEEGNGYQLQYSYVENPMDRGTWWASVHGIEKSQTQLSDLACTQPDGFSSSHVWI